MPMCHAGYNYFMLDERSGLWEGYGAVIPKNPNIHINGMASALRDGQIELFAVSNGSLYRSLPFQQGSLTWKEIPRPSTIGRLSNGITVAPFGNSFLNVIGIADGKLCHVSGHAFTFARQPLWFQFDLPAGTSQTLVAACSPGPGKLLLVVPENKPGGNNNKMHYASFYNETWSPWRSLDVNVKHWADLMVFGSLSAISTAPDRVDVLFMWTDQRTIEFTHLASTDGGASLGYGGSFGGGSPFSGARPHVVALTNPGGLTAIVIANSSAVAARHWNGSDWGQYAMGVKGTGYGNAGTAVATTPKRVDTFAVDEGNQLSPRRYNLP